MTKEQLEYINDKVDIDYIIDNPELVYDIITDMLNEIKDNHIELQMIKEAKAMYWPLMDMLHKENKKLHTKLSKYEK